MRKLIELRTKHIDRFAFRIFHHYTQEMFYFNLGEVAFPPTFHEYVADGNKVVMQSPGVFDNSGKLIYEGDILREKITYLCDDGEETTGYTKHIVVFKDCAFKLAQNCDYDNIRCIPGTPTKTLGSVEVIGNIYENPELLNE